MQQMNAHATLKHTILAHMTAAHAVFVAVLAPHAYLFVIGNQKQTGTDRVSACLLQRNFLVGPQ